MKNLIATFSLSTALKSSTLNGILKSEFPHQFEQEQNYDFIEIIPEGGKLEVRFTDLGLVVKEFYYNRYWNDNFTETYTGAQMKIAILGWIKENQINVEDYDQFFKTIECIIPQKMEEAVLIG